MTRRFLTGMVILAWGLMHGWAQTNANTPAKQGISSPSYLVLLDTSLSMARNEKASETSIYYLVESGFLGKAKNGEPFAVWTFDQNVYPRKFPTQIWMESQKLLLANQVRSHLRRQNYQNTARMDRAVEEILRIAPAKGVMWVFLLTDGDTSLDGTPFDRNINSLFREYQEQLREKKKPFVAVFAVKDGKFIAWSLHTGGGSHPGTRIGRNGQRPECSC